MSEMDLILNIVLQVLCALVLLVSLLIAALCFMHRYYSKNTGQLDENISLRDSLRLVINEIKNNKITITNNVFLVVLFVVEEQAIIVI